VNPLFNVSYNAAAIAKIFGSPTAVAGLATYLLKISHSSRL